MAVTTHSPLTQNILVITHNYFYSTQVLVLIFYRHTMTNHVHRALQKEKEKARKKERKEKKKRKKSTERDRKTY